MNRNGAMKKSGLKGHFPKGSGGTTNNGLSFRESMDSNPDSEGMGTQGKNQMPMPTKKKKVGGGFEIC